ncbi:hypothetical protein Q361_1691 [Flavobacterium croceum DSM 17960]|uniref:Uncharacterized protein n=1 Tax=Flavobacterium croceum DSM 17960 TaxID=1121886 RepID=A0A2S4N4G1_9FLAO|nr:hypothetical protein Q361_1691 [Flavobacterium croceum DSM 17960]
MKKHKGFILLAIVVIAMMVVGFLMKKDRVVYNYGDPPASASILLVPTKKITPKTTS